MILQKKIKLFNLKSGMPVIRKINGILSKHSNLCHLWLKY